MSQTRLEIKVGLFVLVGLLLLAALLISFSKGTTRFSRNYEIYLDTTDVGGIKPGAGVLMAGYPIGDVKRLMLSTNGETVTLLLSIKQQHRIRSTAMFVLEQSGFLGDQFVAVYPGTNLNAPFLESGAHVVCPPPFNLQQTARDASGFIRRIDETAQKLNATIADVRTHVLNQQTLTNLAVTAANMRNVSDRALVTVNGIHSLVESNRPAVSGVVSNLDLFSDQLNQFAAALNDVMATNSTEISTAVKNIESASEGLNSLLGDLQAGKGLAGSVLQDAELAASVAAITENLSVTTSNLNRLGLWGILWSKKPPATDAPAGGRLSSPRATSP
jgi:phospholipid/cholesterol/gamma-HCH transport system substrate-binding protein